MYEGWEQQIAEIAVKANRWLNFSLVCGWLGFALAIAVLVYLVVKIKKEDNNER